jgi:hypothetical protein
MRLITSWLVMGSELTTATMKSADLTLEAVSDRVA